MAYVTGCDWDVFISYCTKNNEKDVGVEHGWVDYFVHQFTKDLNEQRGIQSPEIFIDYRGLLPGEDLNDALLKAINKSAVFIVILSHKYLESGWCKKEWCAMEKKNEFLLKNTAFSERITISLQSDHGGYQSLNRIFIVEYEKVDIKDWPKEFRSVFATKLWDEENEDKTLGRPAPKPSEDKYYLRINKLSKGVAKQLNDLKKRADRQEWVPEDSEVSARRKKLINEHRESGHGDVNVDEENRVCIVIDSGGKERALENLIKEKAVQNSVGYAPLVGSHERITNYRKNFMNKIRVCGGFVIIHEYDSEETITAKMNEYIKAIASRGKDNQMGKKGRAFIQPHDRPIPGMMPPHIRYIRHETMESTEQQLDDFFQEYKREMGYE
ncbi:MAG: toll/interleukin-1 receptor domain-containing protein [Desulfobacteraceae bacterium]|nr:toll/interleukin-1 receptor domain-containing protein [Desulfobacteraceae bacterium]